MPFDATSFMTTTVDQPMETDFRHIPAGEYEAVIGTIDENCFKHYEFEYQKGDRAGTPGEMVNFNVPFVIQDAKAAEAIGKTDGQCTAYMRFSLDFDDRGLLDFGINRNVQLGQIRKAVNQNGAGPWSFGNLSGAGPVMVKVEHKTGKKKDGSPFKLAEVTRVAAIRR